MAEREEDVAAGPSTAAEASAPATGVEPETEPTSRRRPRRQSQPDGAEESRLVEVHEHHYYTWGGCGGCCGHWAPSSTWPHTRGPRWAGRRCGPSCSGARGFPWMFSQALWGSRGGRTLAGGVVALIVMAVLMGVRILLFMRRSTPPQMEYSRLL